MAVFKFFGMFFRFLRHGQKYLIYPGGFGPVNRNIMTPSGIGIPYEALDLRTRDQVILKCYLLTQPESVQTPSAEEDASQHHTLLPSLIETPKFIATRPTVIMFHGNATDIGNAVFLAYHFFIDMKCNVLMMSYRGYAGSSGSPTEDGLQIDAQTGLDYVTSHPVLKNSRIIVYGQSMGGGVAIDVVSKNPTKVQALIVENTYSCVAHVIKDKLPGMLRFLHKIVDQKWNSEEKISLIPATTHILMISGLKDELIPPTHMETLWRAVGQRANGLDRATFIKFRDGEHNNTASQKGYWIAVAEFVNGLPEI